ncbi:hypothetical protein [Cohnella panacarvi]|uniref:hypothetical protein n=1 Tax=Cohnella panacarvi TaxID=400776 RepID=UPI00047B04D4|nr:hypothetical protein [Cohnella panacarvi]
MKKIVVVLMLILAAALGSVSASANDLANEPSPVVKADFRIDPADNKYIIIETAAYTSNYHMMKFKIKGQLFYPNDNDETDKPLATCEAWTDKPGKKIHCKVDEKKFRSNQNYKFIVRYTQFNDDGTCIQGIEYANWKSPFGMIQDPLFFELKQTTASTFQNPFFKPRD